MDALPLWPVVAAVKSRDGEIGWAWDAASATNSDVEEAERRRNYPMSEPPRIRPRRRDPPRQDRQTRVRHHTKKEVQLPPRPQRPQPTEAPPEDEMIRTRLEPRLDPDLFKEIRVAQALAGGGARSFANPVPPGRSATSAEPLAQRRRSLHLPRVRQRDAGGCPADASRQSFVAGFSW